MDMNFSLECASGTNVFYLPVPRKCLVREARYTANANPGANEVGIRIGSTVIVDGTDSNNDLSSTPGEVTQATLTDDAPSTAADPDTPLRVSVEVANACKVGICILVDEFVVK